MAHLEYPPVITRRLPLGAEVLQRSTVHFRVWAPKRRNVEVVLCAAGDDSNQIRHRQPLESEGSGYFSGAAEASVGDLYAFCLDNSDQAVPDPASRFQPQGPAGFSQVVDPSSFRWTDERWPGVHPQGQVLYEMHIGTFTPEGTWAAAAEHLPELVRLGITTLEIMPVADFGGTFGWGYDGVNLFAPTRLYGEPDDFRRFVDAAHGHGLGVILDVVYNHVGNLLNTLPEFSDYYNTDKYPNEWGKAMNFDGLHCEPVREFFLANVRYWIEEFHLDGFRFDATQAIHDASATHILTEMAAEARQAAGGRRLLLVAENEPQDNRLIKPASQNGNGLDMLWNDDFHHAAVVRLTGHNEAYYSDYQGTAEELLATAKHGFLYQGQVSQWQKKPRGSPTRGLPGWALVNYLENHDQVANSVNGARLHTLTSPGRYKAMTVLWLLSPGTPLFFQGQEFASERPFLYFADVGPENEQVVANGRCEFLSQFPSINTPHCQEMLPNPARRETFQRSVLDRGEHGAHPCAYAFHQELLRLRREDPLFRRQRTDLLDGATIGPDCLLLRYFGEAGEEDRLVIVNFGRDQLLNPAPQPLLAPPEGRDWDIIFSSDELAYGGRGARLVFDEGLWRLPGEAAVVLASRPSEVRESNTEAPA